MTPDRAVMLGLQIVTLLIDKKPQQEARRLNLRLERLLRGMMEVDEALGFILEAKPRPEEKEYSKRTAESLGNPLRSAAQIVEALREKQGEIKGTGEWKDRGEGSEANRPGCLGADERAQRGGMMRDLLQGKVAGVDLERLEGPKGEAAWMDLWLRAFGVADATADETDSQIEKGQTTGGHSKERFFTPLRSVQNDKAGGTSFDFRVSRVEVLAFAEMVWERIEMFRRQGEKERADVKTPFVDRGSLKNPTKELRLLWPGFDQGPRCDRGHSLCSRQEVRLVARLGQNRRGSSSGNFARVCCSGSSEALE